MIKLELPQLDIRNLPEEEKAEAVNKRLNTIATNIEIMLDSIEDGEGIEIDTSKFLTSADVSGKANNSEVVHKSGTETITGEKTFTQPINGTSSLTQAIPYGEVDSTSTNTAYTATIEGITELKDGTAMFLKNGVVTSSSGFTINVNGLGAKPVYNNLATGYEGTNPTRDTTIFNIAYTMLFIYSEDLVDGGCWICYRGYDANTNTIGYQLRTNSKSLPMSNVTYRYRLFFTSADGTHFVPSTTSTSTNATSLRDVCQTPIDPFGDIVYYSTTASVAAEARPSTAYLWMQYALTLGYAFNRTGAALTLTSWKPVYIKCAPQANGSAIIDADTPYVQDLPSTEDGKIYIFLGIAYSATAIELEAHHPVYCYKDGAIRPWTNVPIDTELSSTSSNPLSNSAIHAELSALATRLELRSPAVYFDTTANWNAQTNLVGEENAIYVYTDYQQKDGDNIAGVKIGDGNAYLLDNPFLDTIYYDHIQDTDIHITAAERAFWNNKDRCYYSLTDAETLVFTKN